MTQPEWQCVWKTDHSAIFLDTTGVYEPEMEYAEELGSETGDGYQLYRFILERKQICCAADDCTKTHLVPYGFPDQTDLPYPIHQYKEWFSDDIASAADCVGLPVAQIRQDFCSANYLDRKEAYQAIGDYHGYDNLDSYPLTLTDEEFEARQDERWKVIK